MTGALRLPGAAKGLLLAFGVLAGPLLAGRSVAAEQFSADLVSLNGAGQVASAVGKVYVSGGKVRVETHDFPDGFFLTDGNIKTASFIRPAQRVFMDAKQSSLLTQLLVPVDPNDPCAQWQAIAELAGAADQGGVWRCDPLGPERVGERNAVKYRAVSPDERRIYGWVDPQLRFLVKVEGEDGMTIDLANVHERPQPASLFEIPADFRKFDPARLIDRIKQSDVWLDPPG